MRKELFNIVFLLFLSIPVFSQVNEDSVRRQVLEFGIRDSLFVFGKWDAQMGTEVLLKYLGVLEGKEGRYKIMTCIKHEGSHRALYSMLIFNGANEYLGRYLMHGSAEFPDAIERNELVFRSYTCVDSEERNTTRLSFREGIPDQYFLVCKEGYSDLHKFFKGF